MPTLLIVGGGLFGSQAAAYARHKGLESVVFDAALEGAASPASAGLFKEEWAGKKLREHFHCAIPVLERLYGVEQVSLRRDDGGLEQLSFVPPAVILEAAPIRQAVTAIGDGWLEAAGVRHEGWVYIAAGVWCNQFLPSLSVYAKAGSAFLFEGENAGRIREFARSRQAVAFVRDPATTYFSDGTAEPEYTPEHDRQTLRRAADFSLANPIKRLWGLRPYTPGGPIFLKIAGRTWLATGARKMGTILGASYARRLVEEELR